MNRLIEIVKKRPLIFISLSLLIFFTVILVITIFSMRASEEIDLLVTPTSATTTIDGKIYQNGTIKLEPGEHHIHIEKPGFITQDFSFNTTSSKKIYSYLRQTDGGVSWYLNHPEDAQLLTQIGDYTADQESISYTDKYPITKSLPIIFANYSSSGYKEFRVDGGSFDGCSSDFCLKITDTTGGNFELAKNKIKDTGFDPNDYQILYEYKPIQPLN